MGIIRVFLAMSVVTWHLYGKATAPFVTGFIAVIAFYMISGFYMSMVIHTKYSKMSKGTTAFYYSRILRLFPVYFVILAATILIDQVFWMPSNFTKVLEAPMDPWLHSLLVASNIGIVGLDLYPFFGVDLLEFGVVAVAWTLSIEFQYYIMAPLIVRRSLWLSFGLLALTLTLRFSLLGHDYNHWRYYFGPSVWCFFLMGHISYRLSLFVRSKQTQKVIGLIAVAALPAIAWFAGVTTVKDIDQAELWFFYVCTAAAIPFVFSLTKNWRIDALIGELSYPIYLAHLLVANVVYIFFASPLSKAFSPMPLPITIITITIALSAILHFAIERPIDAIRAKLGGTRQEKNDIPAVSTVATLVDRI